VDLTALILEHRDELSPAERRVADVVLNDPQAVAFGTVAEVAARGGTSGATVVRLTRRLGLAGFGALQDRVRAELTQDLTRAAERIRRPGPVDLLDRAVELATEGVHHTLDRVDRATFDAATALLARRSHPVFVIVAEASAGILEQFSAELAMLRPGVVEVTGSPVAVARQLAELRTGDAVVTLDLPRYDRWVLDATQRAHDGGGRVVALTDSELSPLAAHAELVFAVSSVSAGPFDSHLGTLALLEALIAGVAPRLRDSATERLDRIESAWTESQALTDD
jgi:DNA-binding MurR/RpiR family transcriptional regulator